MDALHAQSYITETTFLQQEVCSLLMQQIDQYNYCGDVTSSYMGYHWNEEVLRNIFRTMILNLIATAEGEGDLDLDIQSLEIPGMG